MRTPPPRAGLALWTLTLAGVALLGSKPPDLPLHHPVRFQPEAEVVAVDPPAVAPDNDRPASTGSASDEWANWIDWIREVVKRTRLTPGYSPARENP